jgi:hypothetical protein
MSADNDDLQSLTVMKLLGEERLLADAYQVLIKSNTEGLCQVPTRKEDSPSFHKFVLYFRMLMERQTESSRPENSIFYRFARCMSRKVYLYEVEHAITEEIHNGQYKACIERLTATYKPRTNHLLVELK